MIFNTFDPNRDIVSGRTTRVASGFWPNSLTNWSQSYFVDDFWSLTGSATPNPSYGSSYYDIRRTMYYLNVYPAQSYENNSDPYFSIAYGNINGDVGSGSFALDTASIKAYSAKAVYTEYKNILLGSSDIDGKFTMTYGSTTTSSNDIWVLDFSSYKMKDKIDEGLLELNFSGSLGQLTLIDDSSLLTETQNVYQLIPSPYGIDTLPSTASYEGLGLFYPSNGIVILNAGLLAAKVGISYDSSGTYTYPDGIGPSSGDGPGTNNSWPYNPGLESSVSYTYNHKTLFTSMWLCGGSSARTIKVRKSEYVPSRHYFVRVFNRDFNFSNNPTYVYDGTDGVHSKGTIYNTDFITDPRTYITTIGLYNADNELVAVAKLSRPYLKSFSEELLIRIKLDF